MIYKGSCLCGCVQYEFEGEFEDFYLCHCNYCRKDTGSAHAANLFSKEGRLKWLQGREQVTDYNHHGQGHIKSFCSICGSAVPNIQMSGKLIVVPAGSLETDLNIKPQAHLFYSHRANWDEKLEDLKHFDELPNK